MNPVLRRRRQRRHARLIHGLHRGEVVGTTDPQQADRVQVTVPGLSATAIWAATLRDLGGPPGVGDEVLVGFGAGSLADPYVVGVLATGSTPAVELSDDNGNSLRLLPSGIEITTGAKVRIAASTMELSAGTVTADAAMWKFSGVVQSQTLITESVIASSYTPGAGNMM